MISNVKHAVTALCLAVVLLLSTPVELQAAPVNVLPPCGAGNTTVCSGGGGGADQVWSTLKSIITLLITIAGSISVIMIVVGGIKYSTSGGDAKAISSGKDTLVYAVIGLVISIMAFAIVNFVIGKL